MGSYWKKVDSQEDKSMSEYTERRLVECLESIADSLKLLASKRPEYDTKISKPALHRARVPMSVRMREDHSDEDADSVPGDSSVSHR